MDNNQDKKNNSCPLCQVSSETIDKLKKEGSAKTTNFMNNSKLRKLLVVFLVVILIIAGGIYAFSKFSPGGQPAEKAEFKTDHLEYDMGTVSMASGLVRHTFEIENAGLSDLKINNIRTSCMCTTAFLKIGDYTSPEFGMPGHGTNPLGWSKSLNPGEKAQLEVVFDPTAHGPAGVGQVARIVYLQTNDRQSGQPEFKLFFNVIP